MIRVPTSERELSFDVDRGVYVPLHAIDEPHDGINLETSFLSLRTAYFLPSYRLPFDHAACASRDRYMSVCGQFPLFLQIIETTTNVAFGDAESFRLQQDCKGFLPQTMVRCSVLDDAIKESWWIFTFPLVLRSSAFGVEGIKVTLFLCECLLPTEQSWSRHVECIHRRLKTVLLPEIDRFCPPPHLRFVSHMPEAYRPLPHEQPALRTAKYVELPHDSTFYGVSNVSELMQR